MRKEIPDDPFSAQGRRFLIAYLKVAMRGRPEWFDGGWSAEDVVGETLMDHWAGRLVWNQERPRMQFLAFECVDRARKHWRRDWRTVECVDESNWRDPRQVCDASESILNTEFLNRLESALPTLERSVLKIWLACVDERDINIRIAKALSLTMRRVRRIRARIGLVAIELKGGAPE